MVPDIPSVRDRLWLLAHDETRDLEPHIDVRALEIGLTGATLTDLLLQDAIHIQQGQLYLTGRHVRATSDPVAAAVLHIIGDGQSRTPPDPKQAPRLIDVLRDPSLRMYARTQGMLIAAGVLVEQRRRMRGTTHHLDPANTNQWLRSQFNRRLLNTDDPDATLDCLCAMVGALNLHSALVLPYDTDEADAILRAVIQSIPKRAGRGSALAFIPKLAAQVRHAVGDLATAAF
jgi:hypothetical protein